MGKITKIKIDTTEYDIGAKYSNIENTPTIPSKTSDLTNDNNFITNTTNDLINYYKKTETFTKQEINNLIATITTLNIQVVQTLPTEDISTTTIYLVPKTTVETNDAYDEYIYVSNAWEHIGSTEVDLTNYVTKTDFAGPAVGGVVKVSNGDYGITVDEGVLKGTVKTYAQFSDMSSKGLVSKGTLNNFVTEKNYLDPSKVKNTNSTTAGEVYDVRYINAMIGNIETLLGGI